jgi:Uma2 family endonuclease
VTLRARRIRYTYKDYAKTPDDVRYQLIDGELILSPSPTFYHQHISGAMFVELRTWAVSSGTGKVVCAPMDVYLTETDTVQPDILFISTERIHIVEDRYVRGAPDLVVEILSPSTSRLDLGAKMELYALHGVPHYWIVDPDTRTARTPRLEAGDYAEVANFTDNDVLTSDAFPGLGIDLGQVF